MLNDLLCNLLISHQFNYMKQSEKFLALWPVWIVLLPLFFAFCRAVTRH